MFDKVNVSKILTDHIGTFRRFQSRKYRPLDFMLFFGLPLVVASSAIAAGFCFPLSLISVVATALSICTALLLNLLLLAYNIIRNAPQPNSAQAEKTGEQLLREIYSNIAFAIVVAIALIVIVVTFGVIGDGNIYAALSFSFGIYYLGILTLLTLLMLLKRIYALLSNERVPIQQKPHDSEARDCRC